MNKLALLAAITVIVGLAYLALKQAPSKIPAQKVKPAEHLTSNLNFQRDQVEKSYVPRAYASPKRAQPIQTVSQSQKVTKQSVSAPEKKSSTKIAANKPQVQNAPAKKGKLSKQWLPHLSGGNVSMNIHGKKKAEDDCGRTLCPDRPDSYAIVGVVVETQRALDKRAEVMDGSLANGDGQDRPYLYVK